MVKDKKKVKLKTRRGAAKRFKKLGSGKIKRKRAKLRHILTSKTTKQKRRLRSASYVASVDQEKVEKLMPY